MRTNNQSATLAANLSAPNFLSSLALACARKAPRQTPGPTCFHQTRNHHRVDSGDAAVAAGIQTLKALFDAYNPSREKNNKVKGVNENKSSHANIR